MSNLITTLQTGRQQGESTWQLPTWGHEAARAVYPLFVTDGTELRPIGTAFCVGAAGLMITALHNVFESCGPDGIRHPTFGGPLDSRSQTLTLRRGGLAFLYHQAAAEGAYTAHIRGLDSTHACPPSDLAFTFTASRNAFPWLALPLSFAIPQVGSTVTCIGYTGFTVPNRTVDVDLLRRGEVTLPGAYSHRFQAVEARVKHVFTQTFARGFLGAPCFSIDADVPGGLSGGPVLNEAGFVCGVVSAGASSYFAEPSSLVSLIFPTFLTRIRVGMDLGVVKISGSPELADLIGAGVVRTDGSERALAVVASDEGRMVCAPCPDDRTCIYDDFAGLQAGSAPTKIFRR